MLVHVYPPPLSLFLSLPPSLLPSLPPSLSPSSPPSLPPSLPPVPLVSRDWGGCPPSELQGYRHHGCHCDCKVGQFEAHITTSQFVQLTCRDFPLSIALSVMLWLPIAYMKTSNIEHFATEILLDAQWLFLIAGDSFQAMIEHVHVAHWVWYYNIVLFPTRQYYGCKMAGYSIPAAEHRFVGPSVMYG